MATLPDDFSDFGRPELATEVVWTVERLAAYVLSRSGAREKHALLGRMAGERLKNSITASCPGRKTILVRWPLVVRVAHFR